MHHPALHETRGSTAPDWRCQPPRRPSPVRRSLTRLLRGAYDTLITARIRTFCAALLLVLAAAEQTVFNKLARLLRGATHL